MVLPISIKADEPSEEEHREVFLLLQRLTPIPSRSESTVDTAASIVEVVRTRPVEAVPEEVTEDGAEQPILAPELARDVLVHRWGLQRVDLGERCADGQENAVDLGVLVCAD
jgi:hypothetical protein